MTIRPLGPVPEPLPNARVQVAPEPRESGPADDVRLSAATSPRARNLARQALAYGAAGAAAGLAGGVAAEEARKEDLRLLEELEGKRYEFRSSRGDSLTASEFVDKLHDSRRKKPLAVERDGGPGPLAIGSREDLDPLRYFYLEEGTLTRDQQAGEALRGLEKEARAEFHKDGKDLHAFEAWRAGDLAFEAEIRGSSLPAAEVRSLEDLFLLSHVHRNGTPHLSNPGRGLALQGLVEDGATFRVQGQPASVVQVYRTGEPVDVLEGEVVLATLPAVDLDQPQAALQRVGLLRDTYKELDRATYPGRAEDLWALGAESAGPASLEERQQAMLALARECRRAEHTEEAYRLAREQAGSRPLGEVAGGLAALVEATDFERGMAAFRRIEAEVAARPPAGMDGNAARAAYVGLVQRLKDEEAAARVWDRLMAATLPEAPADRLRILLAWQESGNLGAGNVEAGLEAILAHVRPGETLQQATGDFLALAATLRDPRDGAQAFDLLRRHSAAPGPGSVTAREKEDALRHWLKTARSADEAKALFEAALAAPDEAEFRDRLGVQRTLLDCAAREEHAAEDAGEAWRLLEGRAPDGRILTEANRRTLRLLPAAGTVAGADTLRDALQAGPRTYEEKERVFQAIHAAAPGHPRKPERSLDDLRFLIRRGGDLQAAAGRLVRYLDAAGDADEARRALEIGDPSERFLRLLEAGGRAEAAREGVRLAGRVAEAATVERVLAALMRRHRESGDGAGAGEAVRLVAALMDLAPGASGALDACVRSLEALPALDDWRSGPDGSFRRWLERQVLAGAADRDEVAERLQDLAALHATCPAEDDLAAAWTRFRDLSPPQRRERIAALAAMRAVRTYRLEEDLDRLDFVARTLRRGEALVESAELFARAASRCSEPRHAWQGLRDWLEATGDPSPARLRRYVEVLEAHGEDALEGARKRVSVPVGPEGMAERENILWGLADGPKDLREALEDYDHLTRNLNPRVTLEEAGRSFRLVRRALAGDRPKARQVFDLLHARLDQHPEVSLEDLAAWFARNMTVNGNPEAVIARLDSKPEDLRIEPGDESVAIGGVRIPVRRPHAVRPWAWLLA